MNDLSKAEWYITDWHLLQELYPDAAASFDRGIEMARLAFDRVGRRDTSPLEDRKIQCISHLLFDANGEEDDFHKDLIALQKALKNTQK